MILAGNDYKMGTSFPDPTASLFVVHGALDRMVFPQDGRKVFDAYPGRKAFLDVKQGDHLGPYIGEDAEQTKLVAQATTDYLLWSLRGDADALTKLNSLVDIDSKLS